MTLDSVTGVRRSKARVLGNQDEAWFLSLMSELAALPLGARQLRQAVLNLAIRGRLAPQRSADEPVDALLRRVEGKRSLLVAKKHATSCESLAPVTDEEEPYSVPAGWSWVRLGLISICRDGQRVPVSKEQRLGRKGRFAYYGASGVIDTIDDYIFDGPLLLVGEDGANLVNRSTPIAFIADGQYWVNNHAHVLDGADIDHLRYLSLFINATDLVPYVTGTAQPKMNQAKMNMIPIALPPLAEQKRIVAKVDQLMALCDDLEAKQTKKRDLATQSTRSALASLVSAGRQRDIATVWKTVFQNWDVTTGQASDSAEIRSTILDLAVRGFLGGNRSWAPNQNGSQDAVFELPNGWQWRTLTDVGTTRTGSTPSTKESRFWGGDVPFVTPGDINEPVVRAAGRFLSRIGAEDAGSIPGDSVLMVCIGGSLGKVGYVDRVVCCNQQINAVTPRPDVFPGYLCIALRSPYFKRAAWKLAGQGTLPIISKSKWEAIPIPIPPLVEQKRIVVQVAHLMSLLDDLEAKLHKQEETATRLAESLAAAVAT